MDTQNLHKLEKILGYKFNNLNLLHEALCHSSFMPKISNERLEFLGDRIVNFCIADKIYHKMGSSPEGDLSKKVSGLVRKETLAIIARKMKLNKYINLGKGEEASGGRNKENIIADAVEAVIAAIYLDSNIDKVNAIIDKFWSEDVMSTIIIDAKSRLQELLQSKSEPLPEYIQEAIEGEPHSVIFVFKVVTASSGCAIGRGSSKQIAQQEAAMNLLKILGEIDG